MLVERHVISTFFKAHFIGGVITFRCPTTRDCAVQIVLRKEAGPYDGLRRVARPAARTGAEAEILRLIALNMPELGVQLTCS